jgi:hypothetical protein
MAMRSLSGFTAVNGVLSGETEPVEAGKKWEPVILVGRPPSTAVAGEHREGVRRVMDESAATRSNEESGLSPARLPAPGGLGRLHGLHPARSAHPVGV